MCWWDWFSSHNSAICGAQQLISCNKLAIIRSIILWHSDSYSIMNSKESQCNLFLIDNLQNRNEAEKRQMEWIIIWILILIWAASSEFGTYRLCEQQRFRRACASAQSCQNLRCSLIQAVSQEVPSDRKPDPWPLWMAGHAQLKFVMTECSKTQIRLTRPIYVIETHK